MKSIFHSRGIDSVLPGRLLRAFAGLLLLSSGAALWGQETSQAEDRQNIATSSVGAVVIYSSPVRGGYSANRLVNSRKPGSIAFSGGQGSIIVVDLGKNYKVSTLRLKLENYFAGKIFVVPQPPNRGETWGNLVVGQSPIGLLAPYPHMTSLGDTPGRYVIIVFDTDPGYISDLYVTGDVFNGRFLAAGGNGNGNGFGNGNGSGNLYGYGNGYGNGYGGFGNGYGNGMGGFGTDGSGAFGEGVPGASGGGESPVPVGGFNPPVTPASP